MEETKAPASGPTPEGGATNTASPKPGKQLVNPYSPGATSLKTPFTVGDKVVIEGLKAKPKYTGKAAVVRGRVNARGRFPVTVAMRDGPETIALKLANLRTADE